MTHTADAPTQSPPAAGHGDGAGATTGTTEPTIADAAAAGAAELSPQAPLLQPPAPTGTTTAGVAAAAAGAWHANATVDALWAANETRNAWMRVAGVGWKKLYNASDGSFTALVTLASQARQTGRPVTYRDEADGMVHEIYLW